MASMRFRKHLKRIKGKRTVGMDNGVVIAEGRGV